MKRQLRQLLFFLSALLVAPMSQAIRTTDNWAPVHNYIAEHAIAADPTTELRLYYEASQGVATWEVSGLHAAKTGSSAQLNVGWPKTGEVIELATAEEAQELAQLIVEAMPPMALRRG